MRRSLLAVGTSLALLVAGCAARDARLVVAAAGRRTSACGYFLSSHDCAGDASHGRGAREHARRPGRRRRARAMSGKREAARLARVRAPVVLRRVLLLDGVLPVLSHTRELRRGTHRVPLHTRRRRAPDISSRRPIATPVRADRSSGDRRRIRRVRDGPRDADESRRRRARSRTTRSRPVDPSGTSNGPRDSSRFPSDASTRTAAHTWWDQIRTPARDARAKCDALRALTLLRFEKSPRAFRKLMSRRRRRYPSSPASRRRSPPRRTPRPSHLAVHRRFLIVDRNGEASPAPCDDRLLIGAGAAISPGKRPRLVEIVRGIAGARPFALVVSVRSLASVLDHVYAEP